MWFEPTEVWEVRGADLTVSPVHRCAPRAARPWPESGWRRTAAVAAHWPPPLPLPLPPPPTHKLLTPAPRAAAGRVHAERGVGLRFPRFLRLRPDKGPEAASGPDLVEALYRRQARRAVR